MIAADAFLGTQNDLATIVLLISLGMIAALLIEEFGVGWVRVKNMRPKVRLLVSLAAMVLLASALAVFALQY